MSLTPMDIQKKQFGRALRGYREQEVDEFLDQIVREMERLLKDNAALREQVETLGDRLSQFQKLEDVLHNSLVVAQQSADEMKASARKQADLIIHEAKVKAEQIKKEAETQLEAMQAELSTLIRNARRIKAQVHGMLSSQLEILESEFQQLDKLIAEVAAGLDPAPVGETTTDGQQSTTSADANNEERDSN